MMPSALRPGLSFCMIDGTVLLLDVRNDRYFRLSARTNHVFLHWASGAPLDDEDRAVLAASGLVADSSEAPVAARVPALPLRQSRHVSTGDFYLRETAHAAWVQRRLERRLRRYGLQPVLCEVTKLRAAACSNRPPCQAGAAAVLRAFEHARLLRSPAEKCLPRSLAVALCLARHGMHADVVLAVKLGPFAAHCWAQCGDEVLNDTAEEVARYTPIFAI